jgi:hypothetical protein
VAGGGWLAGSNAINEVLSKSSYRYRCEPIQPRSHRIVLRRQHSPTSAPKEAQLQQQLQRVNPIPIRCQVPLEGNIYPPCLRTSIWRNIGRSMVDVWIMKNARGNEKLERHIPSRRRPPISEASRPRVSGTQHTSTIAFVDGILHHSVPAGTTQAQDPASEAN